MVVVPISVSKNKSKKIKNKITRPKKLFTICISFWAKSENFISFSALRFDFGPSFLTIARQANFKRNPPSSDDWEENHTNPLFRPSFLIFWADSFRIFSFFSKFFGSLVRSRCGMIFANRFAFVNGTNRGQRGKFPRTLYCLTLAGEDC